MRRTPATVLCLIASGAMATSCSGSGPEPRQAAPRPPATGSPSATPSEGPAPTGPNSCATDQLDVTVGGGSGGAAGSLITAVGFANNGGAPCTLDGHPGVSYVGGDDGAQVGEAAERDGTPALVTLAPGEVAHATLRVVDYQVFDPAECRPVPARGFRVYPPDQTASAFVEQAATTCSAGDSLLTVSEVEPGPATD